MVALNQQLDQRSLKSVLIDFLVSVLPGRLPGCQDMATDRILRDYPVLAEKGLVPKEAVLRRLYPHLAHQLHDFFENTQ